MRRGFESRAWGAVALQFAILLTAFCGASSIAVLAAGQTCHPLDVEGPERDAIRATLGVQAAGYDVERERGNYQALYLAFGYRQRWFGVEVLLPAYRLHRPEDTEYGLGDLGLMARGTLLSLRDGSIASGVELAATAPTGDNVRELGMGHAMMMPALWFTWIAKPFALAAQAGYGRVLGSQSARPHHGLAAGSRPLVSPMNREEFEHSLAASLGVQRYVSVQARWFGAVPIGDGRVRQIVGAGATLDLEPFELLVELQVPVVGDPFVARLITQLAFAF